MKIVFSRINNYKKLDYIACWFYKATQYIENKNAKYAFVTTNSLPKVNKWRYFGHLF
ncbi:MAG: DNA methyltransferase [Saprospiraceae bacterium]